MHKTWRNSVILSTLAVLAIVIALELAGLSVPARWTATLYAGAFLLWTIARMIRDMVRGHFGLDILAVVAMAATLAVGEYIATLIIVLMLAGGEALEEYAARRAKRDLTALLDRSPRVAHLVVDASASGAENIRDVPVDDIQIDDVVMVRPSEVVPVDGVLVGEGGMFDESSITGESLPVARAPGDEVSSGAVSGDRVVRVRAVRRSADSQYQQIVALVQQAQESKAPTVRLADRFAIPFTIVSLVLAAIAWAISGDPVRFAEVLVLATPCPLLIAAPVAFLGGLSRAAKAGVIVKGAAVIERLARIRAVAFDKTGTLTLGRPTVVAVLPATGFTADDVLALAGAAEQYSTHVFADAIRRAAVDRGLRLAQGTGAGEVATNGVTAMIDGRTVAVGKPAFIASIAPALTRAPLAPGQAAAYVAMDDRFAGAVILADDPRPESSAVVAWLRAHGVQTVAMLTGDARPTADSVAESVGLRPDDVRAELRPGEKVGIAAALQPRPMMMVGDGVNDAPVLAAADVGVAMGAKGATAAGEAADAVILVDSLAPLVDAVAIGRRTVGIALTAIWIGMALSVGLMIVAMTGVIPAVAGALIQELVDLATILYALRAVGGSATTGRDLLPPSLQSSPKSVSAL